MKIVRKFIRLQPDVVDRLILEITDSSGMQMPEIVENDMQENGITFSLMNSAPVIRHYCNFRLDIIKFDCQCVHDNSGNQVLVRVLLSIARHFGMLAVAEAVESNAEALWLANAELDYLQGYCLAAPA